MNKKAIFCLAGLSCVISTALLAEETGAEKVPENAEVITQEAVTEPTTEPSGVITQETVTQPATEPSELVTQETVTEPIAEPTEVNNQEAVTQPTTEPSELVTQETVTEPAKAVATSGVSTGILAGLAALAAAAAGSSSSSSSSTSTSTSTAASGTLYYTEYTAQYGLASINALSLNDSGYTGSGVKLAIVDSGINSSHSEFSGRTIYGTDFTSTTGYTSDGTGHGTFVASIAAGNRDAIGMRGVGVAPIHRTL